jgi:heme/copper-type cytochrome/quinol oxidase subunit 2
MSPELLAALSEGQRAIAHLVVLLALPVAVGLVYLVRRVRRSAEDTRETQPTEEGER